jgi:drug/metabolite transporter (DMT)-like permease
MATDRAGLFAAIASVTVMGTTFPAIAELSHYPLATGQALRYTIAAGLLFLISRGRPALPAVELPRVLAMSATGLVGTSTLLVAAERSTDPATVGVIMGCLPVVVALMVPLAARKRVGVVLVVAAAVSVLGASLVQDDGGRVTAPGICYSIAALGCEAVFVMLGAPVYRRVGTAAVSLWMSLPAVVMLLIGGTIADGSGFWRLPTIDEALAIGYLGAMASVVAMLSWGFGLARLGPERCGLLMAAVPASALVTSVVLGLSVLTPLRVVGCLVVAGAIAAGISLRPAVTLAR